MSRDRHMDAGCIFMHLNGGEDRSLVARYCRSIRTGLEGTDSQAVVTRAQYVCELGESMPSAEV